MIFTQAELPHAAALLAASLKKHTVVAFHGDMGVGKTTFISALCKQLGSTDAMSSPTFAIINEYDTAEGRIIYHMDWYRLKNEEEAIEAGIEDALLSGHLCLVEWPNRAPGLLPENTLHIYLETLDAVTRRLSLQ